MAETERSWVWVASTASAQAGKQSVLAWVETVAIIAIYWAIARIWDTHVHLLAGLLVMPLMLFRSDESVALGVRWAKAADLANGSFDMAGLAASAFTLLILLAGPITPFPFWINALSANFILTIMVAYSVLAPKVEIPEFQNTKLNFAVGVIAFLGLPLFLAAYSTFYILAPLIIRVLSCVVHLRQGLTRVPQNWRRLIFATDICVTPQPLPDPDNEVKSWSLHDVIKDTREYFSGMRHGGAGEALLVSAFLVVASAPAYLTTILFRWTLKSTAWFYLPLLFLDMPYNGENRLTWMRSFPRTAWTFVRLVLALVGIGVALAALVVDLPVAMQALQLGRALELPVLPLSLLLVLDWSALRPWHYVSLPTALLTVMLFFRLDHLHRREQAGANIAEDGWALRSMVWADRVRSVLASVWMVLVTPPTLRFFHCAGQLPDWPARQLAWFFGPEACVVPLAF
ncbi:MAG: hypothetical protein AAF601_11510 [Pseudomonadota bacterium]